VSARPRLISNTLGRTGGFAVEQWGSILPAIAGALVFQLVGLAVGVFVLFLVVKAAVRQGTAQALRDTGLAAEASTDADPAAGSNPGIVTPPST